MPGFKRLQHLIYTFERLFVQLFQGKTVPFAGAVKLCDAVLAVEAWKKPLMSKVTVAVDNSLMIDFNYDRYAKNHKDSKGVGTAFSKDELRK